MVIRGYKSSDLEACRNLWAEMTQRHREIYDDSSIGGDDPGLEFDGHLSQVGPALIWVAEADQEVVGFVSLIHKGEEAEIEPIVVRSDVRGGGIGYQLVDHAVDEAGKLGVLCLSVNPVARNEAAISFFYDAGFRKMGHIQLFKWLGDSFPGQWKEGLEMYGKSFEY